MQALHLGGLAQMPELTLTAQRTVSKDSNTNKISQKVRIQNLIGCHTSGKVTKAPGRGTVIVTRTLLPFSLDNHKQEIVLVASSTLVALIKEATMQTRP
jgi:hypothetical protein